MSIILNTNELGYKPFLNTDVDFFVIGLKDFCINQQYVVSLKNLPSTIREIKSNNKKIYLNINLFALEKDTIKFRKKFNKLKDLDIDYFLVSDLGILNIFIKNNLAHKVILDLQTYVTNKYSARSLLSLGVKRVYLSKEITLDDIKEISNYNNGNIELLCQGYNAITHSKRPILKSYYENFNIKYSKDLHYIKEESRDFYYFLAESNNNLTVYNDKQYSLFPYLKELINNNITHFRIDAAFLKEEEIKEHISLYKKAINYIEKNELKDYDALKETFITNHEFSNPFLHNQSLLLKEEK